MQPTKISILSTAAVDEDLVIAASAKGFFIDTEPFIRTEPVRSKEVLQKIERALVQSATVVFTSVNAVKAIAGNLGQQKPDWQIYCVGDTTCDVIKKYFGTDRVAGAANDAAGLAEIIIKDSVEGEITFFCGDLRRNELPATLKENNIGVNEIVVYQTELTPQIINKTYDGILFFSPSAVQSFFQSNKLDAQTILFAIGNTTAIEIKKYLQVGGAGSTNKIIVSSEPGKKSLLEKAISYFQTHFIHH